MTKKTLAQRFPLTVDDLDEEILHTMSRLKELMEARRILTTTKGFDVQHKLEVIIPESDSKHTTGRSIGNSFRACLKEARQRSGRKGPCYIFINFDGKSVTVNPKDVDPEEKECTRRIAGIMTLWKQSKRASFWIT